MNEKGRLEELEKVLEMFRARAKVQEEEWRARDKDGLVATWQEGRGSAYGHAARIVRAMIEKLSADIAP